MEPKQAHSTVLSLKEEAIIVAFRRHTLLVLDDCLDARQPTIAHLARSSLHRCLQCPGISRLPEGEGDKPKKTVKRYPIGYFHPITAFSSPIVSRISLPSNTSSTVFAQTIRSNTG